MLVPNGMMELVVAVWLHGHLLTALFYGPFQARNDACIGHGEYVAKLLMKHRKPEFSKGKQKIKIIIECHESDLRRV